MRKRLQFLSVTVLFMTINSGCHGVGTPALTETYINQKDSSQTLELTSKKTLKALIGGVFGKEPVALNGDYILAKDGKVIGGKYKRAENTLILNDGSKEWKVVLQADSSLRDDTGGIWQLQSRSQSFRSAIR